MDEPPGSAAIPLQDVAAGGTVRLCAQDTIQLIRNAFTGQWWLRFPLTQEVVEIRAPPGGEAFLWLVSRMAGPGTSNVHGKLILFQQKNNSGPLP